MSNIFWVFGIYNLFNNGILAAIIRRFPEDTSLDTRVAVALGIGFLLTVACSYLLGSVNFALVLSRWIYHDDIRTHGSGNAGATNMLRTYGKKAFAATFFLDGFKGVVSILLACVLFGGLPPIYLVTAAYMAAFFAVFGHVFPCFSHFRGGKGFATTALCVFALNPVLALILCFVFFPIVLGSHYVSLGSVVTVLLYPVLLGSFDTAFSQYGVNVLFAFLMAMLVTWSHRANVKRLFAGTESKVYFFGKKPKDGEEK